MSKVKLSVEYIIVYVWSAISNKEHRARLPPKPGSQPKKDGQSHLPVSSPNKTVDQHSGAK